MSENLLIAGRGYCKYRDQNTPFEETDAYCYTFTTNKGEQFAIEILTDMIDWEFVEGIIED